MRHVSATNVCFVTSLSTLEHDDQALDGLAFDEVRLDDFVDVLDVLGLVPHPFRVHDHERARVAKSEAASAHRGDARKLTGLDHRSEPLPKWLSPFGAAAAAGVRCRALLITTESVVTKDDGKLIRFVGHWVVQGCSAFEGDFRQAPS